MKYLIILFFIALFNSPNALANSFSGVVVHHTATKNGKEFSLEKCNAIHTAKPRGWDSCGYSYLIQPNGAITESRGLRRRGAHCGYECNKKNIGIAFVGTFTNVSPSVSQLESFEKLVKRLEQELGELQLSPHKDHKSTLCPGIAFDEIMKRRK